MKSVVVISKTLLLIGLYSEESALLGFFLKLLARLIFRCCFIISNFFISICIANLFLRSTIYV